MIVKKKRKKICSTHNQDRKMSIVAIDKGQLDEEWVKQPTRYLRYAMDAADAYEKFTEAKAILEAVKAEIDRKIRANPESYGLEKITESVITTMIPGTSEYLSGLKIVRRAKHKYDILQAVVSALEHKKRALEKLCDLHSQSYFSTPREPTR